MASCVFAAYGMYVLARALGSNRFGGVVAGIAFAFLPQRAVYLGGHLNFLTGSMWLPWLLLATVRARENERTRVRWAALGGLAYALSIARSWHFILLSSSLLLIWAIFYLAPSIRSAIRSWTAAAAAFFLVAGILIGPFLVNAALARRELGPNALVPFATIDASAVSLERLLLPSAINPLFWNLARVVFPLTNGQDGVATFGYLIVVLFCIGLVFMRPPAAPAMVATLVAGLLLMLGPTLHVLGEHITLHAPDMSVIQSIAPELIQEEGSIAIPMPAYVAYKLFPPFRSFHAFSRWELIVAPILAGGAALGITHLALRVRSRKLRYALGALLMTIMLVEFNIQPLPVVTTVAAMKRSVDDLARCATRCNSPGRISYALHAERPDPVLYDLSWQEHRSRGWQHLSRGVHE